MNGPEKPASALKKGTEKEVLSDSKMEPKISKYKSRIKVLNYSQLSLGRMSLRPALIVRLRKMGSI